MKAIVRKNDEAVSPVIATILMVAITVVLAAVLYVMVSGLITSPQTSQQIGAAVTSSGDGTNWIVTFTSVPSGLGLNTTFLTLTTTSGAGTNVTAIALGTMICYGTGTGCTALASYHGVRYYATLSNGASAVSPNDRLTIVKTAFPAGTGYSITQSGGTLASGKLQ